MQAAREGEFDGKALFHRILETFEGIRGKIAQQHGTKDAERFGRRRDFPGSMTFYFTELDQAYSEYNTALLSKWSVILKAMEAAGKTVHEKDYGLSQIKVEKLEAGRPEKKGLGDPT